MVRNILNYGELDKNVVSRIPAVVRWGLFGP
jgi:hypothetical protein